MSPEQITTESRDKYENHVVEHIQKWIPSIVRSIKERHSLFVDLMERRLCHRNGMPFIPLYETKYTIVFMSIAIPQYEDGHVLIIPKKRFRTIEEMSSNYLKDLMSTVQIVGTVVKQTHTGYNLLLNNGEDAGQYILHVHFHLIPRKEHDHITIEFFKKQKLSSKAFIAYNMLLKNNIKKFLQEKKNT
ncbi:MAG: HIT family protein [bacterium]